jgi:O-antigen ligase
VQRVSTLQSVEQENSAQQRLDSWAYCFQVGWENPVFGGGFDFYSQATIEKYNPKMLERWVGKIWSCHSSWFTVWSEHGIPAFTLWMVIIVSTFASVKSIKRKLRKISSSASSKLRYWPPMIEISMVGYVVSASFVDFAYFDLFYQLIAATVIMRFILKQTSSTETYEGNETDDRSLIQREAVLNQAQT